MGAQNARAKDERRLIGLNCPHPRLRMERVAGGGASLAEGGQGVIP
jgi:hypothetical protein